MSRSTRRSFFGLLLPAAVLVTVTLSWAVTRDSADAESASIPPPPPASTLDAQILMRVGLSAPTICAAGVTQSSQVTALVDAVQAEIALNPGALQALDEDFSAKRTIYDALLRKVQSGLATAQEIAQLPQAKQDLDAAEAARESYKTNLRTVGLSTVSSPIATIVNTIHANRDWNELATQYLVANRSEADWVALREALATERIAAQYGEPFPVSVQSYLAAINATPAIAAAKVNLDTFLASVQTAWNTAASN